ncbi:MAG: phenylalanine--tRNA ligase subunit beta [Verrucomicrobiae bacterium]|nr:phenylalanine--tRNA ligase subunit beta [Verrucomicrobiae bacterium]
MKITLNWLKKYVDFDWSPEELALRLTMLGMEVESVARVGGEFEGIVVAQVITREKHPNADKLSVCRVSDGKGERQIVCGADNFKPGDKVPLILPGYTLPAKGNKPAMEIKVGKIRGVDSYGMMCSPGELGLPGDNTGLLILPQDAPVGKPFAEYLGRETSDVVYDLEITPNRPDLNSVIGIAREISALTGNPLKIPQISQLPTDEENPVENFVTVKLDAPDLCPRYVARVIRGVKIGPSPDWLCNILEKAGLRPINNVVDITNFVMLETGQPLHAFDYHLVGKDNNGKPTIVVRRAADGEKFVTLDGKEHTLTNEMLLIADPQKGIALAGVMGGQNSEINDKTVDVLIESAYFNPSNIRRTSKKLALRTDASYRFERGCDIGGCDYASLRCVQLMLELAGGKLCKGVVDAKEKEIAPKRITLRYSRVNAILGLQLKPEEIDFYLTRLELKPIPKPKPVGLEVESDSIIYQIPTFRVDLKREIDLIEEVARIYGVDKIPSTQPRGAIGFNPFDAIYDQISEARRILTGLGLDEAQGQTLINEKAAKLVEKNDSVLLANPLSSDMNTLRPSLLPGLLDSLRNNISHKNYDVALFEIGKVFKRENGNVKEQRKLGIALTGLRNELFWEGGEREAKYTIFDLKGVIEEFFDNYGIRGVVYTRCENPDDLFLEHAAIMLGGKIQLGRVGQVNPLLARSYDLRDAVYMAELDFDAIISKRNPVRVYKQLPQFPGIRRDVAMIVAENITHDHILQVIKKAKPQFLEDVQLFDVFRGKNIPEGHKSMAYAFIYRSTERTLTDNEVNQIHEKLIEELKAKASATIRSS